jgi:YegS/Rv2252/BmrU family lipid kinase
MKSRFIYNPNSGANRHRPEFPASIRDFIRTRGIDADFAVTEGPGHAAQMAALAARSGCEVVVAVGGDGTVNEVAQGLIGTPTALALVPCGSGNGLALHLGLPRSPLAALRLATGEGARIATIDTGVANGRPFVNAMGLGLDAVVGERFNRLSDRGLSGYLHAAWTAYRGFRPSCVRISGGGFDETLDVLLVAVANSDQYGNHARIAPGARVDDGRLDLVAIRAVGLTAAALLVPRLFLGNLGRSRHVLRLTGPQFVIERPLPAILHTDGETHFSAGRVEVSIRPRSLRLLVPAASPVAAANLLPSTGRFALQLP